MKVFAITYNFLSVPEFSIIICKENNKYYYPMYENNQMINFEEISFERIKKYIEVKENIEIRIGDSLVYAYHCDCNVYIGSESKIKEDIGGLIMSSKICDTTSLIEAFDFLGEEFQNYKIVKATFDIALEKIRKAYKNNPVYLKNCTYLAQKYLEGIPKPEDDIYGKILKKVDLNYSRDIYKEIVRVVEELHKKDYTNELRIKTA